MNKLRFIYRDGLEIVVGKGDHAFPAQTHESYIFGALLRGSERMSIGGVSKEMTGGDCYVLRSNTTIEIHPHGEISYVAYCFKGALRDKLRRFEPKSVFCAGMAERMLDCMGQVRDGLIEGAVLAGEFIRLFSMYETETAEYPDAVARIADYIAENINSKYSLDELSRSVNLSKYHLTRVFKRTMGVTPKQYHQQCRVREVKKNILRRSQSAVAYDMEFSSQSHLEKVFMEYMGTTLGKYVSAMEGGADEPLREQ